MVEEKYGDFHENRQLSFVLRCRPEYVGSGRPGRAAGHAPNCFEKGADIEGVTFVIIVVGSFRFSLLLFTFVLGYPVIIHILWCEARRYGEIVRARLTFRDS